MERIVKVIKYGGSLITYKPRKVSDIGDLLRNPDKYIQYKVIRRAGEETSRAISDLQRKNVHLELWASHGAGVYGHSVVDAYGVRAKVREYTNFLNEQVTEIFRKEGVEVVPLDAAKTVSISGKPFNVDKMIEEGEKIISNGKIPFSYGTVVGVGELRIFSADDFVEYAAMRLEADQALMITDTNVSTQDPKKNPDAKPLKELASVGQLEIPINPLDKTGGLFEKIIKLQRIRSAGKTRCRIVNGMIKGNIYKALIGEDIPTEILTE